MLKCGCPHKIIAYALLFCIGPALDLAYATQGHGEPEGLFVHQMSHMFFAFSMGVMIYWIRIRKLILQTGWRYVQYSALLFIGWTLDAFSVHFLDEAVEMIHVSRVGMWQIQIETFPESRLLALFYYLVKLDHLLCAPAMFFLYMGLKRLLKENGGASGEDHAP